MKTERLPGATSQIVPLSKSKRPSLKLVQSSLQTTAEKLIQAESEIDRLNRQLESRNSEIHRLLSRCERKNVRIEDDIEFFETGLELGVWENRVQMRRRISRLKGARDYKGSEG